MIYSHPIHNVIRKISSHPPFDRWMLNLTVCMGNTSDHASYRRVEFDSMSFYKMVDLIYKLDSFIGIFSSKNIFPSV